MYLKACVLKLYYMVFQRSMHEVEPLGVCSICWKIQTGHGCMCAMPFHMNETSEQTRQHYSKLKTWSRSLTTHVMQKKWEGGWPALKEVLHLSTYCIFLQEYCFLLKYLVFKAVVWRSEISAKKSNRRKAELHWRMYLHMSTHKICIYICLSIYT